jgi:hypothetical protein
MNERDAIVRSGGGARNRLAGSLAAGVYPKISDAPSASRASREMGRAGSASGYAPDVPVAAPS